MPDYKIQLVLWKNLYDWCKPYIKEFNNAIDIGCDTFGFARWMENDFNHVYCFDFRNRKQFLNRNVQNLSKFTYFNTGLGEKETVRYTKPGVGRIKGQGHLRVNIKLLDSFNLQNINFIKLDVEGYEEKILNGSKNTILKYKPTVVIEQNRDNFDAKNLIESWGYECVSVFEENNKPHDYLFTFKH